MNKRWLAFLLMIMLSLSGAFAEETGPEGTESAKTAGNCEFIFFDGPELSSLSESVPPTPLSDAEEVQRAVIGKDRRVTVPNPAEWPYSAIAYLEICGSCGDRWAGTGFLVGPDGVMLTAARCLRCPEHDVWANSVSAYFGYRGSKNYLYQYSDGMKLYIDNAFLAGGCGIDKDFAIIRINPDVSRKFNWFGACWGSSDPEIADYYVQVAGFDNGKLRYDSGYLDVLDEDHIVFQMDEAGQNTGGPIFTQDGFAVGIVISEEKTETGIAVQNIGYRLTREVWAKIREITE